MSKYGRTWEQIMDIRQQIVALLPGCRVDSVESASEDVEKYDRRLRGLLQDWYSLETGGKE